MGAPEEFWGSSRRDCNPNKQNANDHNNNNKNLQLPLQWLYERLRLIVPPSDFHSRTLLQSKLQLELKNSTTEAKHTHTHTQTLSLSLKHRQNALLSEVLEKHPKIQNQIQASSLQV